MQTIQRQLREDGVCVLTFDRPQSPANIFDRKTLEELDSHIGAISQPSLGVKGLVIISAKPSIFIAGADLKALDGMSGKELSMFIELGQNVFSHVAALPFPTAAAIHGACVGGGYEVALACDWRVASPEKATKIGLPETKLGILPAWGGSTRLPRLIGIPKALDVILGGKTMSAQSALKRGMIDATAPKGNLLDAALQLLARGKRQSTWTHGAMAARAARLVIGPKARAEVEKKTRGNYPAVTKALEVVLGAAASDDAGGLALERNAVAELAGSPAARNLIRLFFQQERAKKLTLGEGEVPKLTNAVVIGAGVMGSGIAQWISARGLHVIMKDVAPDRVAAGMANIAKVYAAGQKRHVFSAIEARQGMDRISPVATDVPLRRTDIVIEAAVEKMEIKKAIFRDLDERVREDAILATNTSALSITELAAATRHPSRVIGIHFFNPVHQMQLVELVIGRETSPDVARRALGFVQALGKLPVVVKDSPGFVVNRVLLPYMVEAGELFDQGVGIREIDDAMLDFGMPMGPLRLIDEVGVDVAEDVARTLAAAFPDRMKVPPILGRMLEAGFLGRKTGKGYYVHHKGGDPQPNGVAKSLRTGSGKLNLSRGELQRRMVLLMVNEAARCVEEGIVDGPADVDFAMVMGTGFAPFHGGPLRYADSLGTAKVAEQLKELVTKGGPHFAPSALLLEKANSNQTFYED
jgi:3-hydroxyacyl-CoA dehydrogenase/enoyl-CoA hydratase/3-hydroxybutyryl-CoA epimerase